MKRRISIILLALLLIAAGCSDKSKTTSTIGNSGSSSGSSSRSRSGNSSGKSSSSNQNDSSSIAGTSSKNTQSSLNVGELPPSSDVEITLPDTIRTFYVDASKGNDTSGAGTLASPYRSLDKARDAAAAYAKSEAIRISIRAGEYTAPTLTDAKYSGKSATEPILYEAYNNEKVTITGGKKLSYSSFISANSTIKNYIIDTTAKSKLLEINLAATGITDLGNLSRRGFNYGDGGQITQPVLYIDNKMQQLARWPNAGKTIFDEIVNPGTPATGSGMSASKVGDGATFRVSNHSSRLALWTFSKNTTNSLSGTDKGPDIWIDGILTRDWAWTYNKVQTIDLTNNTVKLLYGINETPNTWCETLGWYYENVLEEIDMPGEYYIDRSAKKLYLYPPESFGVGSNIVLTNSTGTLMTITNVKNVAFKGIDFSYGRNNGIEIKSDNVTLDHITLSSVSGQGIRIEGSNNKVINSKISGIGKRGIYLAGGNTSTLAPANNMVYNCIIDGVGEISKVYNPSVQLSGVGQILQNNLIKNAPHMGITVNGNDHLIKRNEFFNISGEFADMGIIYMNLGSNPTQRGTVIEENYFHHYEAAAKNNNTSKVANWAVYLDNGTQGIITRNNVFAEANAGGINYHQGGYNTSTGNIFINIKLPMQYQNSFMANWAYNNGNAKNQAAGWKSARDTYTQASGGTRVWKSQYSAFQKYPDILEFLNVADSLYNSVAAVTKASSLSESDRTSIWLSQRKNSFTGNYVYAEAGKMNAAFENMVYEFASSSGSKGALNTVTLDNTQVLTKPDVSPRTSVAGVDLQTVGSAIRTPAPFKLLYPKNGETVKGTGFKVWLSNKSSTQTNQTDSGVMLRWEATLNCDSYVVELSKTADFKTLYKSISTGRNYVTAESLPAGTYYWRVKAKSLAAGATTEIVSQIYSFTAN